MISVIIPIYNASATVKKIIECLTQQAEKDFEAILVDDGSTDNSGDFCQKVEKQDTRFRYIRQENAGASAARNRGLQEASGEFITFLDADDVIAPNYLQELLRTCKGADIAVCDVCVRKGETEVMRFTHAPCLLTQTEALNALFIRRTINSGPCAKLFRREVLDSLTFPPLKAYEDILFVKNAFANAQRIAVTNQTEYVYIQNPQGAMSSFLKAPSLDIIKATDELLGFICEHKELEPATFYITASHLMQYVQPLMDKPAMGSTGFMKSAQQLFRKYKAQILSCSAFPWKEKIIYLAFAYGLRYENKHLIRIGD
ncbi:MAG: glycosyltransferase family 2 protein [Faecousia sp.]